MQYIIILTTLLSFAITFYYVFIIRDNEKTSKKTILQFLIGSFIITVMLCYPLIINILLDENSFWGRTSFLPIYFTIIALSGLSKKIILKNQRVLSTGLVTIKIIILLVYLPLGLIYILRRVPVDEIVTHTMLITCAFFIFFILYSIAIRSRYGNYVSFLNVFTVGITLLIVALISNHSFSSILSSTANAVLKDQASNVDVDYEANNIVSFRDPNYRVNPDSFYPYNSIYDVEKTDSEMYYVVYDMTKVSLSMYSFQTNQTTQLMSYVIPDEIEYIQKYQMAQNTIERVGDTIYYFSLNGVYTLDGASMTKHNEFSVFDILYFNGLDDVSYIAHQIDTDMYDIYQLHESAITYIEQIDYSVDVDRYHIFTNTHRLYILDNDLMTLSLYGGETFDIPPTEKNYTVEMITPTHIIFGEYAINDNSKDYCYIVDKNGIIEKIDEIDFRFQDVILENNGSFYYGDYKRSTSNPILYLYNDLWEEQKRIKLRVLDESIDVERDGYIMRYEGEELYYVTFSGTNDDYYIELNELIALESTIDYDYFDYMDENLIYIYFLLLVLPSTTRNLLRELPSDDDKNKNVNEKNLDDKEEETTKL